MNILLCACAMSSLSCAVLANPVVFNSGTGATGHAYERVDTTGQLTYPQAALLAAARSFNGTFGQLATFNGPDPIAEQAWMVTNVVRTPSLPNPGSPSLYWFGAERPNAESTWTWIGGGGAVPSSLVSTWSVDVNEGEGVYGAVIANNYGGINEGDYRQDDPAFRMGGFVVEYDSGVSGQCGPADVGIAGGLPGHDGVLDNNDFISFINYFFVQNSIADMGVAGGLPGHDGQFDNNDFIAFINAFFAGC